MGVRSLAVFALPWGVAIVHCASSLPAECDEARVIFTGDVQPGATLVVTDDKNATLPVQEVSARVSFEKSADVQSVRVDLPNVNADPTSARYLQFEFPSGPEMLATNVGVVVKSGSLRGFVFSAGCSQNATVASTTAQILGSRGTVDPVAKKVDGNFWRRIAVDVDWSGVGCNLSSIRGRVVFDVTPAKDRVEMACETEKFDIVGTVEAPPSVASTPDASSPDAASPDASK